MNALQPLVKQLTKMIKEGYDLSKDQLPEVAKQILRYYFWVNLFQSLAGTVGTLIFSGLAFKLLLLINADSQSMDGRWFGLFILGGVAVGFAAVAYEGLVDLFRVVIAPKLFLLDTLASYL